MHGSSDPRQGDSSPRSEPVSSCVCAHARVRAHMHRDYKTASGYEEIDRLFVCALGPKAKDRPKVLSGSQEPGLNKVLLDVGLRLGAHLLAKKK